jgi:STE24 endopeptidase
VLHFLLIVAVVASLCVSENAPKLPVTDGLWRLGLALAGMLVVVAFAQAASWGLARKIRDHRDQRTLLLRQFGRFRAIHGGLWITVVVATIYGLRWTQLVRFNWHLNDVVLIRDLFVLLPAILPLVASWAAFYEVDRWFYLTSRCANETGAVQPSAAIISRPRYLALHARHYLGLVLLPVLTLFALQDTTRLIAPRLADGELAGLIVLVPLVSLFALFPLLLSRIWRTEPLADGPLRAQLERFGRRCGFRPRQILVWHTDRTVVNAAVAGFLPRLRYVFLTDALLASFSDEEIEAVFGHEIGHIRHRHLFLRLIAALLPAGLWIVCRETFPDAVAALRDGIAGYGLSPVTQTMLFAPAGLVCCVGPLFAMISKLLEHEADLFACRTASGTIASGQFVAGQLTGGAVGRYAGMLEKLGAATGQARTARSWLHPSIAQRVAFLQRMLDNPGELARFETRMRRLSWLLASLVAACIALVAAA